MKQLLLLFCCCILTSTVSAQRTFLYDNTDKPATISLENAIQFATIAPLTSGEKGIIDTLLPPAFEDACALAPAIIGTDVGGFVTGSNGYGDIAKLQRINFPESYNFDLTTVRAAFILDSEAFTGNLLDDVMIVAKAYNDTPDGSVGEFLGDSDSIRIGDLDLTDTTFLFVDFPFSTPIAFTETESIIVGVDFENINQLETGNIGIISTASGCGDGTNAFDVFRDSLDAKVFSTVYDSWGMLDLEMYFSIIIDREPAVSTRNPIADYGISASPNPAFEQLTVSFDSPGNDQMTASLLATDGRTLREQTVAPSLGLRAVVWNIDDLPAGIYLYQVAGPKGVETGRVVVR